MPSSLRKQSSPRLSVVSQKTGTPGATVRVRNSDRPDGNPRKAASKQASTPYKAAQYAEFQRGIQAHEPLTALCTRLKISKNTASSWIRDMNLDSLTVLRPCGLNALLVAETLHKLLEAKIPMWNPAKKQWDLFEDGKVQLKALCEVARLLGMYSQPAQKKPSGLKVVLGSPVEAPSSIPNTNLRSENRERKETEANESRNPSEALESAGKPTDERPNETGRPSDVVSQLPSTPTANDASHSEEARKRLKDWKKQYRKALQAHKSTGGPRSNERLSDNGYVADPETQTRSITTANVFSECNDTEELRERWRKYHRSPLQAEFPGQSPWTTPIAESAAERFLELVTLMKSGYDEESSSWADVLT